MIGTKVHSLTLAHGDLIERVIRNPGEAIEVRLIAMKVGPLWFEMVASDMRLNPDIDGIVITARNVDARRQAELTNERQDARYRQLVQRSSDLVAVLDGFASIEFISGSVRHLLGCDPVSLSGTNFTNLLYVDDQPVLSTLLVPRAMGPRSPLKGPEPRIAEARLRACDERMAHLRAHRDGLSR